MRIWTAKAIKQPTTKYHLGIKEEPLEIVAYTIITSLDIHENLWNSNHSKYCLHYHVLGKLHVVLVVNFDDDLGKFTYYLRSREKLFQI